ncbi:efflux RND transporter permease subunit [Komagataeibacter oboediens]|uniref:Efflux RND transporter permease subunit n=1 Tax=Komagataeibacter oboediens TaxID=65958 RepID=A0ABS5SQ79_9PROT|nr:efflux RND transporter permease subunit [Komagataeibacter oboediens]MBL7234732.1 efflux RND transporter permease subunit [Komagataeibacter oboediens]MBT0676410.1 efflux RND transporter permease subunit [Komagataeibacter oboediens]MBT0679744.1 efflux RND transporter permease subunit [Komagataeibacter oboediens]
MGIVGFALRRPYTFLVGGVLILLLGIAAIFRTPTDVFPEIDIPVVTVVWYYEGLDAAEAEKRISTYTEFSESFFINNLRTIESQTTPGLVLQKLYFQPGVNVDLAVAQTVSATNSVRAFLPPGMQPPIIMQYSASSVPVLQLSLSSDKLTESDLYDYGLYRVRQQLAPIPGTLLPPPYGGATRQVMIDINTTKLNGLGLTPLDISNAINVQNLTLPGGTVKFGPTQYDVRMNGIPDLAAELNNIPLRKDNLTGAITRIRDVAQVRMGTEVQHNVVRREGRRSVLLSIMKAGNASTLDVVNTIRNRVLPLTRAAAPPGMKIDELFDQSLFVKGAINGVASEAVIAGLLTAAMILAFLASWRSTLIVAVSIPLAILSSIAILSATGQTLNLMTLGGLALAVGILVDDATVTIENIHRIRHDGAELRVAVLDGAAGIALPTLVSTLAISCVFVSVEFLTGPSRYLFTPMALAVVYAMLASYAISRTLVPIFAALLLRAEERAIGKRRSANLPPTPLERFGRWFDGHFERFRDRYSTILGSLLASSWKVPAMGGVALLAAVILATQVGQDFFPSIDAGEFKLHVRAPEGTRIETTEKLFDAVEDTIRQVVPASERELVLDNIGLPFRYSMPFDDGTTVAPNDGQIMVALKEHHHPTPAYVSKLRTILAKKFPECVFYFQPADIVTQILNFGIPAQVDIRITGFDQATNRKVMQEIRDEVRHIPGLVDVHLHQQIMAPELALTIDRTRAQDLGLTLNDVARNVMISLASSNTVTPNFWVGPNGVQYPVAVQTPQYDIGNLNDLRNTVVSSRSALTNGAPTLLDNVATITRGVRQNVISHSNIAPTLDIDASVEGQDLGTIARAVNRVIDRHRGELTAGNTIEILGQIDSMNAAFSRLEIGLLVAAIAVYLLMVVNFQSWMDPFVVVMGLPGAMCGIVFMLFVTGTTFSVPSLMGAIMSVGVASANSILLVTFAKESRADGLNAVEAAMAAGRARLRPILMTSLAMVIGMLPMSLGLGDGGEQNAPLGRAVIGGLMIGTCATLFVVPWLYSRLRRHESRMLEEYENV